ncbi:hypothetical protein SALBM135S_10178 [Streptomyces alboniger]
MRSSHAAKQALSAKRGPGGGEIAPGKGPPPVGGSPFTHETHAFCGTFRGALTVAP